MGDVLAVGEKNSFSTKALFNHSVSISNPKALKLRGGQNNVHESSS